MRLLRWRQVVHLVVGCVTVWLIILLYTHTSVRLSMDSVWNSVVRQNLDSTHLKELMSPAVLHGANGSVRNPLDLIVLQQAGMLNFYFLPIRRPPSLYTELTSANRDTSYPLAPDFTFHLEYHNDNVLLYEDHGPGCVYRIFFMPNMPQDTTSLHQLTSKDFRNAYLNLVIDGHNFWFSIQQIMDGKEWPFLSPINTQHPRPASGVGTYTPFCYQSTIKISYQHNQPLPPNLFTEMINCSKNDLQCSTHIYSGISRHKFAAGTKVASFAMQTLGKHKKVTENAAYLLSKPDLYGPDSGDRCELDCFEMCAQCRYNLLRTHQAGVVSSIKMRVFETATSKPLPNWNNLSITAHFDGAVKPQLNKIPLGSLFAATGSMNEMRGASMGRRKRMCSYSDGLLDLPSTAMTSYLYYPMPFWRNALIMVEGSRRVDTSLLVCYKLTVVENHYKEEETAYFQAAKSYFTDSADGYRSMLQLNSAWGHIVGLQVEVDNLRAQRDVPLNQRWAALQADMLLYIDGMTGATMLGTGLEDYFSYAHGFALAENTSYSFVGVYHASPRRSEPLSWHCYRLHIIDPIPFLNSVQFVFEGTREDIFKKETPLTYEDYSDIISKGGSAISHLVLYYAREQAGATVTDILNFADPSSEKNHNFAMVPPGTPTPKLKSLQNVGYLGNRLTSDVYNRTYREFGRNAGFSFSVAIILPNKGVILRREFYSKPKLWNAYADVFVSEKSVGVWFVPFGTLVNEYSLQQDDFLIGPDMTNEDTVLNIKIIPRMPWCDISYQARVLHT